MHVCACVCVCVCMFVCVPTVHVVVSAAGPPTGPTAPEGTWLASPAPAPAVEVAPAGRPAPHGVVAPVVAPVVPVALARRRPHHAGAGVEGGAVVVGGRGVREAGRPGGLVGGVAVHGHLHVVHVVHGAVSQQPRVHCKTNTFCVRTRV